MNPFQSITPQPPVPGLVSLVGAGPGHPDLLTVRGLRRLQAATVILPDALLDESFEDLYPAGARVIPVGKRGGRPSTAQEHIQALMVEHARRGERVVRLKNGDPLLFGRGFEEAQALAEAGIPFEVVPGVSALQAGAAAAEISLTHRGLADEVRALEGRHLLERPRDWESLARNGATLALFMATAQLQPIARRLLEAGAPPDLPLVLVEQASRPGQTVTRSVLAFAAGGHLQPLTEGPGIVYLGPAAALRMQPHERPSEDSEPIAAVLRPERLACAAGGRRGDRHRQAAAAARGGRPGALGGDPA